MKRVPENEEFVEGKYDFSYVLGKDGAESMWVFEFYSRDGSKKSAPVTIRASEVDVRVRSTEIIFGVTRKHKYFPSDVEFAKGMAYLRLDASTRLPR